MQRKRKRDEEQVERAVRPQITDDDGDVNDEDSFMDLPSEEEVCQCYKVFYDATSLSAVQTKVCGVCARECGVMDGKLSSVKLSGIPNRGQLQPVVPHPAHDLYDSASSHGAFSSQHSDQSSRMSFGAQRDFSRWDWLSSCSHLLLMPQSPA